MQIFSFSSTLTSAEFQRKPQNEPILDYKRGSTERKELETAIDQYWNTTTKVPLVINGKKVDGEKQFQVSVSFVIYCLFSNFCLQPYEHSRKIAEFSHASVGQINEAIEAAVKARAIWQNTPLKSVPDYQGDLLYIIPGSALPCSTAPPICARPSIAPR